MHPETKKKHKKHALSNINTDRKSKATTKSWFSRLLRHPARKRSGSILGQTHTRLLTYLLAPDPHMAEQNLLEQLSINVLACIIIISTALDTLANLHKENTHSGMWNSRSRVFECGQQPTTEVMSQVKQLVVVIGLTE